MARRRKELPIPFKVGGITIRVVGRDGEVKWLLKVRSEDGNRILVLTRPGTRGVGHVMPLESAETTEVVQWVSEEDLKDRKKLVQRLKEIVSKEFSKETFLRTTEAFDAYKSGPKLHLVTLLPEDTVRDIIDTLRKMPQRPYGIHRIFYPGPPEEWLPLLLRAAKDHPASFHLWLVKEFNRHYPRDAKVGIKRLRAAQMLHRRLSVARGVVEEIYRNLRGRNKEEVLNRLKRALEIHSQRNTTFHQQVAKQLEPLLNALKRVPEKDFKRELTFIRKKYELLREILRYTFDHIQKSGDML